MLRGPKAPSDVVPAASSWVTGTGAQVHPAEAGSEAQLEEGEYCGWDRYEVEPSV